MNTEAAKASKTLDEYAKAGGNPQSPENQRILEKLVRREVHYCASALVYAFARGEVVFGKDCQYGEDDIYAICTQDDYQSAAEENGYAVTEDDDGFWWSKGEDKSESAFTEESDAWRDACESNNIDPQTREAYEHWIVSGWFRAKLAQMGEMTTDDFFGLTIWGRCCTGQSIYMDGVIARIAAELQILNGQESDWKE